MPAWIRRWIARIPRLESHISFADWVWRGLSLLGVLGVGWWTAARAWTEGQLSPYGTLGYVVVIIAIALGLTLVLMGVAWAVAKWRNFYAGTADLEAGRVDADLDGDTYSELVKLIDVRLKLAFVSLATVVGQLVSDLASREDKKKLNTLMQYIHYLRVEVERHELERVLSLVSARRARPVHKEVVDTLATFVEYYYHTQSHIVNVIKVRGMDEGLRQAIERWLPADRAFVLALQDFLSTRIQDDALKSRAWSIGPADSRFQPLLTNPAQSADTLEP
jgi:hypothetical protein